MKKQTDSSRGEIFLHTHTAPFLRCKIVIEVAEFLSTLTKYDANAFITLFATRYLFKARTVERPRCSHDSASCENDAV